MIEKNIQPEVTQALITDLKVIYQDLDKFKSVNSANSLVAELLSIPSILIIAIKENNLDLYLKYLEYVDSAFQVIPDDLFNFLRSTVKNIKTIVKKYLYQSLLVNKNYLELINNNFDYLNDALELKINSKLFEFTQDIDSRFLKKINLILYHLEIYERSFISPENKMNNQDPFDFIRLKNENLIIIFKQYEDAYTSEKRDIFLKYIFNEFIVKILLIT